MPTLIDELVVQLGLDTSKFDDKTKESLSQLRRFEGQARKHAGGVEDSFAALGGELQRVQNRLLGIASLFLGGLGIEQFVQKVTSLTNALSRSAGALGLNAQALSAWGNVGALYGMSREGVQAGVAGLSQAVQGNRIIQNPALINRLAAMRMPNGSTMLNAMSSWFDKNGEIDQNKMIMDMSRWAQSAHQSGMPTGMITNLLGGVPGMNQDLIQLIEKGPDSLSKMFSEMKKMAPTEKEIAAANRLTEEFARMEAMATKAGNALVEHVEPFLNVLLKLAEAFLKVSAQNKSHLPWWTKLIPGMAGAETIGQTAGAVAQSNPGWWEGVKNFFSGSSSTPAVSGSGKPATFDERFKGEPLPGGAVAPSGLQGSRQDTARVMAAAMRQGGAAPSTMAGVMANVNDESRFNPALRHPDQPHWSGEAHYAHGLFQEGGAEWNRYDAWLKRNHPGADWRDPALQTSFLVENLKTNYPKVWERMQNGTKEEAAAAFVSGYLKPRRDLEMGRRSRYLRGVPGVEHYTGQPGTDIWAGAVPITALPSSALTAATTNNSNVTHTSTAQTHVGEVNVYTQAQDPYGIGVGIKSNLEQVSKVTQANTGPN